MSLPELPWFFTTEKSLELNKVRVFKAFFRLPLPVQPTIMTRPHLISTLVKHAVY